MFALIYPIVLFIAKPLVHLRLRWRARREPEYGLRQAERFGQVPADIQTGPIWFHTVSAGETIAAAPMIAHLAKEFAELPFLVTTMTPTGSDQVQARLADYVQHCYAPYDFATAVEQFYARVQPRMLILMETELWPNLINHAAKRNIPVLLVNARLSARSARGYKRVASLTRPMLGNLSLIACQNEDHRQRFIELGAEAAHVEVFGNVKFDVAKLAATGQQQVELKKLLGITAAPLVWIAASTHPGEDAIVFAAFAELRKHYPALSLILVPRHPHRAEGLFNEAEQLGYTTILHSERLAAQAIGDPSEEAITPSATQQATQQSDVVIGDVMGTLLALYGLADVAFVGGSLVDVGGHNPIEPALHGIPILSGEHRHNFADVFNQLEEAGAVVSVASAEDIVAQLRELFAHTQRGVAMGRAGLAVIESNRGATMAIQQLLAEKIRQL